MAEDEFETRSFKAGENIFREGDMGAEMYILQGGRVRIWRGQAGDPHVLGRLNAGAVFGEMALIDDRPRMATATAEVDSVCQVVQRDQFQSQLDTMSLFLRTVVKIITLNIRSLATEVERPT